MEYPLSELRGYTAQGQQLHLRADCGQMVANHLLDNLSVAIVGTLAIQVAMLHNSYLTASTGFIASATCNQVQMLGIALCLQVELVHSVQSPALSREGAHLNRGQCRARPQGGACNPTLQMQM